MTKVAPGWHPDPTGRHVMRYWDGQHWTEQVSDPASDPVQTDSAPDTRESPRTPGSLTPQDGNNDWRWSPASIVLAIIAVLVLCGVAGLLLYNRHRTSTPTASAFADTSLTTPSVITDTPTTAPWYPSDFSLSSTDPDIAYKFLPPSGYQCDAFSWPCWAITAIPRLGCPQGLSVEVSELDANDNVVGSAVDYQFATVRPGQSALLKPSDISGLSSTTASGGTPTYTADANPTFTCN